MTENEKGVDRLKEIIKLAHKLKWVLPPYKTSYPLMQLSEVEKCMIAMFDDFELGRMRKWVEEGVLPPQSKPKWWEYLDWIEEGVLPPQSKPKWWEYLDWNEFDLDFIMKIPNEVAREYALEYRRNSRGDR